MKNVQKPGKKSVTAENRADAPSAFCTSDALSRLPKTANTDAPEPDISAESAPDFRKLSFICAMSGNYVQRGEPALFERRLAGVV